MSQAKAVSIVMDDHRSIAAEQRRCVRFSGSVPTMGLEEEVAKWDAKNAGAIREAADHNAKAKAESVDNLALLAEAVQILTQRGAPTLPLFVPGRWDISPWKFTGRRGWYFQGHHKALIDGQIVGAGLRPIPRGEHGYHPNAYNDVGFRSRRELGLNKLSPVLTLQSYSAGWTPEWLAMVVGRTSPRGV